MGIELLQIIWMKTMIHSLALDQKPGPSGSHAENLGVLFDTSQTNITAKIAWERGAKLINLLLNKAAVKPSSQASGELPDVCHVCEWHYRDLMHFPEAADKGAWE